MQTEQMTIVIDSLRVVDVQNGLRRVAEEVTSKPGIWMSYMSLRYPTVKEDKPYFEVEYYQLDTEDIENREDYLEAARENVISSETPAIKTSGDRIVQLRIQNPLKPVESQDDVRKLLEVTVEALSGFGSHQVTDVIYHDFVNDDALHQPLIHIYLSA